MIHASSITASSSSQPRPAAKQQYCRHMDRAGIPADGADVVACWVDHNINGAVPIFGHSVEAVQHLPEQCQAQGQGVIFCLYFGLPKSDSDPESISCCTYPAKPDDRGVDCSCGAYVLSAVISARPKYSICSALETLTDQTLHGSATSGASSELRAAMYSR